MEAKTLPKSVVIIGAGASGLFTARRLRQLGVENITILEREEQVGGKCSTYVDPENPSLRAERGAVVIAPNYGEVIDALIEKGIGTERTLGAKSDTVEILNRTDSLSPLQSMQWGLKVAGEIFRFNRAVRIYRKCCKQRIPIPEELEKPFAEYAEKHHLENITLILKPFVSGFGYGDMRDCPTYSVLEYMGTMTIPFLIAQHLGFASCELRSIQGGFQNLMEKIAEDFHVITSATITKVNRQENGVVIEFLEKGGKQTTLEADALVLAVSPKHWEELLGKAQLTAVEKACVDHLTYYRYPVVICRLEGLCPSYVYRLEMLNKDHFGHVAFVSTLDKRENATGGRLCSAYINQLPHHNNEPNFDEGGLEYQKILKELKSLPGVTGVEIMESKIWEDYFPTLPWQIRLNLEAQQYVSPVKTLYVGSYALGSFEDVACVANRATHMLNHCFDRNHSSARGFWSDIRRFFAV